MNLEKKTPLMKAVKNEQLDIVEQLLSKKVYWDDMCSSVQVSAHVGNIAIFERLLSAMKRTNHASFEKHLEIVLLTAASRGHCKIIETLLEHGVDIEATSTDVMMKGWTSLHFAADNDCDEVITLLLNRGAKIDAKENYNRTPIDIAFECCSWKAFNLLNPDEGQLLCSMACRNNFDAVIELLEKKPELINQHFFYTNTTLLHMAVMHRRTQIVKYLLARKADIAAYDKHNRSPLHLAHFYDEQGIVDLLEKQGAKVTDSNSSGRTVLHTIAMYCGVDQMRPYLENLPNKQQWINARDSNGSTLLHEATGLGDLLEMLLAHGADPAPVDCLGCGPALRCIISDHLFTDNKQTLAKIWSPIRRTPVSELHVAAALGKLNAVRWLIEDIGEDVDVGKGNYATPMHFAVVLKRQEIIDYLISKGAEQVEVPADSRKMLEENYQKAEVMHLFRNHNDNFDYNRALLFALDQFSMTFNTNDDV